VSGGAIPKALFVAIPGFPFVAKRFMVPVDCHPKVK
jgi:hypothetical protein